MKASQRTSDFARSARRRSGKARLGLLLFALAISLAGCGHNDPAALVASAKNYIAKGDFNASVIQLKNALQKDPKNAEARYLLGLSLLKSGDAGAAEIELDKAVDGETACGLIQSPNFFGTIEDVAAGGEGGQAEGGALGGAVAGAIPVGIVGEAGGAEHRPL